MFGSAWQLYKKYVELDNECSNHIEAKKTAFNQSKKEQYDSLADRCLAEQISIKHMIDRKPNAWELIEIYRQMTKERDDFNNKLEKTDNKVLRSIFKRQLDFIHEDIKRVAEELDKI